MNREELIAYDRWLTENKWGSSEIITPEQAADLYLAEHPLPPAEGAEEILERAFNNGAIRRITYIPDIRGIISAMNDFATLHAQRLAEKMVEERSEFIKKAVIRFFYTEVDLNFCTREYRDRVEWYFNTYQHEIFKLPKTSLDNFKSREK